MKRTLVAILIALLFVPVLPMIAESSNNDNWTEQKVPDHSSEKSNPASQSNSSFTPIPSPQNYTRIQQTFSLYSEPDSNYQDNPNVFAYEYDDGKVISLFKDGYQTNNGLIISPSIRLLSYPEQGTPDSLVLDVMNKEFQIDLDVNFTHFLSCKPYIRKSEILSFCGTFESEDSILNLGNNTNVSIKENQDILIQWNETGHVLDHWIPQITGSAAYRRDVSVNVIWKAQFFEDSIFMLFKNPPSQTINFPNGSIDCLQSMSNYCNILAKVNLNGTVEDFLVMRNYNSNSGNYGSCSNIYGFQISNKSAIQINLPDDCMIWNSSGNQLSFTTGAGRTYLGFDMNLTFIRSIPQSPCSHISIYDAVILPERTYYTVKGGISCSNSEKNEWNPLTMSGSESTIVSKLPNGSIDWTYAWGDNTNNMDGYSLIALSYGVIWTGPYYGSELQWSLESNSRNPPYLGPGGNNRDWSPIFTHDGNWIDIVDGRVCGTNNLQQERPLIVNEFTNGFSCAFFAGNQWSYKSLQLT